MGRFQEQAERCKGDPVSLLRSSTVCLHPWDSGPVPCAEGRGFGSAAGAGHILRVSPVPPTAARAEAAAPGKPMEAIPARSGKRGAHRSGFRAT